MNYGSLDNHFPCKLMYEDTLSLNGGRFQGIVWWRIDANVCVLKLVNNKEPIMLLPKLLLSENDTRPLFALSAFVWRGI